MKCWALIAERFLSKLGFIHRLTGIASGGEISDSEGSLEFKVENVRTLVMVTYISE